MKKIILYILIGCLKCFGSASPQNTPVDILVEAVISDDFSEVQKILYSGFDINTKDSEGQTALFASILISNLKMIGFLLDSGADPNVENNKEETPLLFAIEHTGNLDSVKLLVEKGATIRQRDLEQAAYLSDQKIKEFLETTLKDRKKKDEAMLKQKSKIVLGSLSCFGSPTFKDSLRSLNASLLIQAIRDNNFPQIEDFLEKYPDINSQDQDGNTPLIIACGVKNFPMVKFLSTRGANPNTINHFGNRPLSLAVAIKDLEIIKFLRQKQAIILLSDLADAETSQQKAIYDFLKTARASQDNLFKGISYDELIRSFGLVGVKRFLESKENINAPNEKGYTLLSTAVSIGNLPIAEFLLKSGADPNLIIKKWGSALNIAVNRGQLAMTQLLLENHANPNNGYRFHLEKSPAMYKLLIQAGAKDIELNPYLTAPKKFLQSGQTYDLETQELLQRRTDALEFMAVLEHDLKNASTSSMAKVFEQRIREQNAILECLSARLEKIPDIWKFSRLRNKLPGSSEFTGALEWAHRKNITGKNTHILILEKGGPEIKNPNLVTIEGQQSLNPGGHSQLVASVAHETAPDARILVYSLEMFQNPDKFSPEYKNFFQNFSHNTIVNASFGSSRDQPLLNGLFALLESSNLLVIASGNSGRWLGDHFQKQTLDPILHSPKKNLMIISSSVDYSFEISSFSNKPGPDGRFQERLLCTLGNNIFTLGQVESGTSLSAPAISGVAALILGAYPNFSMEEVASVLLESAERNFFIPRTESGHKGIFIYENIPPPIDKANIFFKRFDPAIYGRGILSVRRAFIYGDILKRVKEEMPQSTHDQQIEEANAIFQLRIKRLDDEAAGKIQTYAKKFLARQKQPPHETEGAGAV
jgi:hypothetical protein